MAGERQTSSEPPPMEWIHAPSSCRIDLPRFNGHAEVEAELEQQLEEDVLLRAVGLEVLDGGFEGFGELLAVRLPRPDVAAGELEDTEAEVARRTCGFSFRIFFPAARRRRSLVSSAMLRGLPILSQNFAATFWSLFVGVERLGKLNERHSDACRRRPDSNP